MTFWIYRWCLAPASLGLMRLLTPILPAKIRMMFEERRALLPINPSFTNCILIHAASGEIEYAKPVIRAIRQRWPGFRIVVSYFSPSAKRLHRDLNVDEIVPLPFDRPHLVQKFLDRYSPVAVLIARSDIWPEFVHQCRAREIHTVLFSATASPAGAFTQFIGQPMRSFVLSQLSVITCVSEEDAKAFRKLTDTPVLVHGDTRYEQVLERLKNIRVLPIEKRSVDARKIAVLGSTWPEDDEVFLDVAASAQSLRWIWAPHEVSPKNILPLMEKLKAVGLKVQLFSETKSWDQDVLLVDQIGVLAELYSWGDFAFVGGSFKGKVHSVMEPLAAGLPVMVGPYHRNNREAVDFQSVRLSDTLSAVEVIRNSEDARLCIDQKISPQITEQLRDTLRSEIRQRAQATAKLLDVIGMGQNKVLSLSKT